MTGVADVDDEIFELVNEADEVVGTAPRAVCHAQGLLHRAVYCWIADSHGRILLQQRSAAKRMGPNQWDLSVAEHLQPGETYLQAAVRGLEEELGVRASPADLEGPLAPTHMRDLVAPDFHDKEFVQSFLLRCSEPPAVAIDKAEVQATRWTAVQDLRGEVQRAPDNFTAWILAEGASLGWLDQWLGGVPAASC